MIREKKESPSYIDRCIQMSRKFLTVCICTISSLLFFSTSALANLVLGDGGPTGQWYNPERDNGGEAWYLGVMEAF